MPYYPQLDDARRVSQAREGIVCVPIHSFQSSRRQVFAHQLDMACRRIGQKLAPSKGGTVPIPGDYTRTEWGQTGRSSFVARIYDKGIAPYFKGRYLVADIARLRYPLLREMLASIRQQSAAAGHESLPIVVTNHPKDIQDFAPIERFIREAANSDDIKFITLRELSERLQQEEFPIRRAQA